MEHKKDFEWHLCSKRTNETIEHEGAFSKRGEWGYNFPKFESKGKWETRSSNNTLRILLKVCERPWTLDS